MSEQLKPNQVALPSRESISQIQVNNVLSIFGATANFLIYSANLEEEKGGKLDGGARMAAEATLINACARLDSLLTEKTRWEVDPNLSLEKHLAEIYKQNARMLSAQADAYAEVTSPHRRLQPSLVKMPDNTWIAFCGDPTNLDNALVGAGTCPANALDAFDALFKGEIPEHLAKWLAEREASIASGAAPLEFKQQPEQQQSQPNETQPVDEKRTEPTENLPKRRKFSFRNRPKTGADPKISGETGGK